MPATLQTATVRAGHAAASRASILEHAIAEFAVQGVAGARTAAIAEAAGVNKALLYYYFKDKDALYSAALHSVFGGLMQEMQPLIASDLAPGEKLLRVARAHFEYLLHNPNYQRLIQQELSRARFTGEPSADFRAIGSAHFGPLQCAGMKLIREGISCGDFRKLEAPGVLNMMIGMNVFYFLSAPVTRLLRGVDPFSPTFIRAHLAASLNMLAAAVFADRDRGIRLARTVAAAPLRRAINSKASASHNCKPRLAKVEKESARS
jgi:TetR/AcrR family transcriptional regulator